MGERGRGDASKGWHQAQAIASYSAHGAQSTRLDTTVPLKFNLLVQKLAS